MVNVDIKQVNIVIEAGADYQMYFVLRDNSNNLIDLTGAVVEAQLREFPEAQDYLQFTATHNGSGGRVSISMPHEDTSAIPYTSGVYDVFITDTDNVRDKYLTGEVAVIPSVTKPVAGEIIYLLSFASEDDFPSYGMVRRLYFSHATNHMYRWNGTDYVDIVTDGEAATVEVGDVETLPAGSDATVENVGSLLNAVFDFGIPEGNGIASIEKTGTDVLTDTYTVTFTDPSVEAFDFDVTNGKGIVSIAEVVSGLTHTFTVTFNDGDTFTYTLTDGNGIVSVEKTGATDNVDHYRITFDDGTYFDYDVTNVDTSEYYDKDDVDDLLADKADVGDSYTKDEEDALLADKADSADLGDLASKDTVDWDSDIDNIPSTFPPEGHNHDDRYYTETEMDSLLADKADADDVYTKDEVDDALADKADSADVYTKDETDALLADKAPVILSSASGSIASFADGSPAPVTALSVSIEPVQDLHGYDNPWPAGGGANLADKANYSNVFGITVDVDDYGGLTINGTTTDNCFIRGTFKCDDQTATYTWALFNPVASSAIQFSVRDANTQSAGGWATANAINKTYTFTVDEGKTAALWQIQINSGNTFDNYKLSPMIVKSSTAPSSFAPYSNICPISGHTSATVTRTGINIWDEEWELGTLSTATGLPLDSNSQIRTKNYISVKPNTTYRNIGYTLTIYQYDINHNMISYLAQPTGTFTTKANTRYLKFWRTATTYNNDISINYPSTDTQYHAYQGQTLTIDLDGTRYGAMYDALTGVLTVTQKTVTFDGSNDEDIGNGTTPSAVRANITMPSDCMTWLSSSTTSGLIWSNEFVESYNNATYSGTIGIHYRSNGNGDIVVGLGPVSNPICTYSDFRTWLSQNPLQVIYTLATPITVTLTPSQLSTLLGTNNIWADTGDVAVEYRADTKLFVQGQIAETLDAVKKAKQIITDVTTEMVAPRNLAEGDYVIVGDDLLKTTATVASGSTLTIDINCVKTTVAEALIALATASE